jgi:hypothetical protein
MRLSVSFLCKPLLDFLPAINFQVGSLLSQLSKYALILIANDCIDWLNSMFLSLIY